MQVREELARREKQRGWRHRSRQGGGRGAGGERDARESAEYEAKSAACDAKAAQTGKKPGGREPQPPVEGPLLSDQVNLTDEKSRIMPMAGGAFEHAKTPRRRW
jgi:hypothetical protein